MILRSPVTVLNSPMPLFVENWIARVLGRASVVAGARPFFYYPVVSLFCSWLLLIVVVCFQHSVVLQKENGA